MLFNVGSSIIDKEKVINLLFGDSINSWWKIKNDRQMLENCLPEEPIVDEEEETEEESIEE